MTLTAPAPAHLAPQTHASPVTAQPSSQQPMNLNTPQQTPAQEQMRMRGGDGGGMCPGRFCFIIPCPFPCDFCCI